MKATDHIKRAAFEKAVDYFLADPEHNIVKIMDLIGNFIKKVCRRFVGTHLIRDENIVEER